MFLLGGGWGGGLREWWSLDFFKKKPVRNTLTLKTRACSCACVCACLSLIQDQYPKYFYLFICFLPHTCEHNFKAHIINVINNVLKLIKKAIDVILSRGELFT